MKVVASSMPRHAPASLLPMKYLRPLVAIGGPLLLWEALGRLGIINSFLFPIPSSVAVSIWEHLGLFGERGNLIYDIAFSLFRLISGLALATVFGTLLGLVMGLTRWGKVVFDPLVSLFMPVPTLAWTPVLLLLIGIDNRTTILIVFIASSFEIILNVRAGIENMDPKLFWAARSMGFSRSQLFGRLILPATLPYLITGVRLGTGYAWRALIAGEMLAASAYGLGFIIFQASEFMDMKVIYGGMVCIAVLGYFIENVLIGHLAAVTVDKWGVRPES